MKRLAEGAEGKGLLNMVLANAEGSAWFIGAISIRVSGTAISVSFLGEGAFGGFSCGLESFLFRRGNPREDGFAEVPVALASFGTPLRESSDIGFSTPELPDFCS